jgi:hypothetical protein
MPAIFISYRQDDSKGWAVALRDGLAQAFGDGEVFLDKDALHAGNWREQIARALAQCKVVLVIIGADWLTIEDEQKRRRIRLPDDVHRYEVALALSQSDLTVIPVRVDNAPMPKNDDLPEDLWKLTDQQSREIGDSEARRRVDLQALIRDIESVTGLVAWPPNEDQETHRASSGVLTTLSIAIVLSIVLWVLYFYLSNGTAPKEETPFLVVVAVVLTLAGKWLWRKVRHRGNDG